jgi:RNA polymerase sigma factor (sigma-70 family)
MGGGPRQQSASMWISTALVAASYWGGAFAWTNLANCRRSGGSSMPNKRARAGGHRFVPGGVWSMSSTVNEAMFSVAGDEQHDDSHKNILEDRAGHINRDLAERIWSWEQERRTKEKLPKLEYSVRKGLRLVDSMVDDVLYRKKRRYDSTRRNDDDLRSDLVQEGLSALLDALSRYRQQKDGSDFESYARRHIHQQLQLSLEEGAERPLKLPHAVQSVVKRAHKLVNRRIQEQRRGNTTTTGVSVAEELEIPPELLQKYLRLARSTSSSLSMESTVEIRHLDKSVYRDKEEWELYEGFLLDNGHSVAKDQLISEYLDETIELEGDDQAWVQQEQMAGPLPQVIPDTDEPSPDDLILQELIRTDLGTFLTSSLDPTEVQVVRLTFGLQEDSRRSRPQTMRETARALQIPDGQVSRVLARALDKLRASFNARFVDPGEYDYDDDDPDDYIVDSV